MPSPRGSAISGAASRSDLMSRWSSVRFNSGISLSQMGGLICSQGHKIKKQTNTHTHTHTNNTHKHTSTKQRSIHFSFDLVSQ